MKSNIKRIMTDEKITVSDLSKATGISRTTITPLSKDDILPPKTRVETLVRISKALHVSLSDLFSEENYIIKMVGEGFKISEYYDFASFYTGLIPYYIFPVSIETEIGTFTSLFGVEPVISISDKDRDKAFKAQADVLKPFSSQDSTGKLTQPRQLTPANFAAEIRKKVNSLNPKYEFTGLNCFFVSKAEFNELKKAKSKIATQFTEKYPSILFCGSDNCTRFINGYGYLKASIDLVNIFKPYISIPEQSGMSVQWFIPKPSLKIRYIDLNNSNSGLRHPESKEFTTLFPLYGFDKLTLGNLLSLNGNVWLPIPSPV